MSYSHFAIAILVALNSLVARAGECNFESSKMVLSHNSKGYTASWVIADSSELGQPFVVTSGGDKRLWNYRRWVASFAPTDQKTLLRRQMKSFAKSWQTATDPDWKEQSRKAVENEKAVINGTIGHIHPMNCLESIPFRELLKVVDLRKNPAELYASFFRKDGQIQIVGDFYDQTEMGTAESKTAEDLRESLTRSGWTYWIQFHNHPFFKSKSSEADIAGTVIPSGPDVKTYLEVKPVYAIISNGFDTIDLAPADWDKYLL